MRLVNQVIEDINKAKKINLILTGGNSPLKFYDKLFRSKVNWKKVNLFMTDERAVNIKSKNSNYKKINSILSKNNLSEKLKPLEMKSSKSKNVSNTSKSLKRPNQVGRESNSFLERSSSLICRQSFNSAGRLAKSQRLKSSVSIEERLLSARNRFNLDCPSAERLKMSKYSTSSFFIFLQLGF